MNYLPDNDELLKKNCDEVKKKKDEEEMFKNDKTNIKYLKNF